MAGELSTFLKEIKAAYLDAVRGGKGKEWIVVMGNEAGDLDSMASAIAYAYFASKLQGTSAVALTQTSRTELHLRAENLLAFEISKLDPESDILCIDDIPNASSPFPSSTFALVDHNRLLARFTHDNPAARVVAVIDHHEDEGLYRDTADPRIVVVPTGSASSLVTQLYETHPEHMLPELATLLLCSIVVDTHGLKPGGKAEAADRRAAQFLIPRAAALGDHFTSLSVSSIGSLKEDAPHETPGIEELDAALQEKKSSVAHLGTTDLLRRDYKEYTMTPAHSSSRQILVGLSSVPVGFASWLRRHADFWSETEQFMTDRGLTVLGILTSFRDKHIGKSGKGKHRKEQMYVVREDEELAGLLFDALQVSDVLKLKRKKFPELGVHNGFGHAFKAHVWKLENVEATRKVTAPFVKSVIEGRARGESF